MENMPLFSVLIANYNNAAFIDEAINSVLKQSYKNWEIVIVDDASTDNSVEVINRWLKSESRIFFYENDRNYGCGYTKRKCVELSNGEICGILDPDDALMEDAVKVSVDAHLSNANASLVYSNCYICDHALKITSTSTAKRVPRGKTLMDCLSADNVTGSHFATFKRALYNKTPGIDAYCLRAVDQDLYYKLEEVGEICHIDDVLYKYRIHDGGLSLGKGTIKAISWHFYVIIEACKRRGLKFENYIPLLIEKEIVKPLKKTRDFTVGSNLLKPFRYFKKLFS